MALPPHRKVVFEDALDRPPKGSKAREVHFSDDINETGSLGTRSTGSLDQLQSIEGWLSAREHFRAVAAGFPRQTMLWWRITKPKSSHIFKTSFKKITWRIAPLSYTGGGTQGW